MNKLALVVVGANLLVSLVVIIVYAWMSTSGHDGNALLGVLGGQGISAGIAGSVKAVST